MNLEWTGPGGISQLKTEKFWKVSKWHTKSLCPPYQTIVETVRKRLETRSRTHASTEKFRTDGLLQDDRPVYWRYVKHVCNTGKSYPLEFETIIITQAKREKTNREVIMTWWRETGFEWLNWLGRTECSLTFWIWRPTRVTYGESRIWRMPGSASLEVRYMRKWRSLKIRDCWIRQRTRSTLRQRGTKMLKRKTWRSMLSSTAPRTPSWACTDQSTQKGPFAVFCRERSGKTLVETDLNVRRRDGSGSEQVLSHLRWIFRYKIYLVHA